MARTYNVPCLGPPSFIIEWFQIQEYHNFAEFFTRSLNYTIYCQINLFQIGAFPLVGQFGTCTQRRRSILGTRRRLASCRNDNVRRHRGR